MLPRTLSRSLISSTAKTHCAVCTCRCGAAFNGLPTEQRRAKGGLSARQAPSTWKAARRREAYALNHEQARVRREAREQDASQHYRTIQKLNIDGQVSVSPDDGVEFLNAFAELAAKAKGKNVVDIPEFQLLVQKYALGAMDLWVLSFCLLRWVEQDRALGKKLLFTLSATGNEEATVRILSHALLGSKMQANLLRSSEILYARGHLREIARRGLNYRAMVLEGKIAYELGDDDYAIQMWEQAMDAAVAVSEQEQRLKEQHKYVELKALRSRTERDLSELSSPWIEKTMIHYERYGKYWQRNEIALALAEREKARKANEIGCQQDDPTSHYHAAEFFKDVNPDGSTKHTSSWLYHMTKAAATGHVKAAHALAEFYASSGWKYIEDEPPDHVKPTPFDSYPAPASSTDTAPKPSGWRSLLGLEPPATTPPDPKESMFQAAVFPSTPSERWDLARYWVEPAMAMMYAPSFLFAAKMMLEQDIWGQAYAPKAALELTPARYTFASKEDYEAGTPISPTTEEAVKPDEPNPKRDPSEAKAWLREIFYAAEAHRFRQRRLQEFRTAIREKKISNMDADVAVEEENLPDTWPADIRKWLRYPDVLEMWEGEVESLVREAKQICEREGWDIHDNDGGLMFKHGLGRAKSGAAKVAASA